MNSGGLRHSIWEDRGVCHSFMGFSFWREVQRLRIGLKVLETDKL